MMPPKPLMHDQREPRSIGDERRVGLVERGGRAQSELHGVPAGSVCCVPLPDGRCDQAGTDRGKQLADERGVVLNGGHRQVTAGRRHARTPKSSSLFS